MERAKDSAADSTADLAPMCVPIEIRFQGERTAAALMQDGIKLKRWFRLGMGLGPDRIRLQSALPPALRGLPLRIRLHLPPPTAQAEGLGDGWDGELLLSAVATEVVLYPGSEHERAETRLLMLQSVTPADRARIESYVTARMLSSE